MFMLHGYCPKADPFHDRHHGIRRPEIPQINNLSFRKIFVINPIRRLVWTQIAENKAAARTQYPKGITKHAGLGLKMVKGKSAADEIKAQVQKRERRGIGLHPSNVRPWAKPAATYQMTAMERETRGRSGRTPR